MPRDQRYQPAKKTHTCSEEGKAEPVKRGGERKGKTKEKRNSPKQRGSNLPHSAKRYKMDTPKLGNIYILLTYFAFLTNSLCLLWSCWNLKEGKSIMLQIPPISTSSIKYETIGRWGWLIRGSKWPKNPAKRGRNGFNLGVFYSVPSRISQRLQSVFSTLIPSDNFMYIAP